MKILYQNTNSNMMYSHLRKCTEAECKMVLYFFMKNRFDKI